jgi:phenylpyruvate tautomerase PptA (4-oxalocrotonate tautomerase family)
MAIIQCDIRLGRSEAQKRELVAGVIEAVCRHTGCTVEEVFLVMREMPGFNFVEAGRHVPDYQAGPNGEDVAGLSQLMKNGIDPELG